MNQQELLQLIDRAATGGWTKLDLRDQELTELPPEIGQLTKLRVLLLGKKTWASPGNQLTELPPEICQLVSLTFLDLSDNQLTAAPPEIGQLSNLTKLDLYSNELTAVSSEIGQMSNLTHLNLSSNPLMSIPSEISQLTGLMHLHLSGTQLSTISPEISQLTSLIMLDLSGNWLTIIPSEIGQLARLAYLDLSFNQISVIPPEITQLINLTYLDLSNNQLTALPEGMQRMIKLEWLDLRGNSLFLPQEVLEENNPALILETYFAGTPLREAKMLLVGQENVGKTSLTRRLIHDLPPEEPRKETPGVDIHKWPLALPDTDDSVTINLWDFGGQGIYQATHQFFFTSRSLYLVLIDASAGEREGRLHHWLRLVSSLSDNAPVIVVVNKQDPPRLQLDERDLKAKYRNLAAVCYTSCTTGAGIANLHQTIANTIARQLPRINDRFQDNFLNLKAKLEAMQSEEPPYIPYEEYKRYCREAGIDNPDFQRAWVGILHKLGVILNYQDDRRLEGTQVLNPDWITDGVYRILIDSGGQIKANGGILTLPMLDDILDHHRYPRYRHHYILGMMERFELCFPIPGRREEYLIPDLLPTLSQTGFLGAGPYLEFQYDYGEFMPGNILSRLMVRLTDYLVREKSWRTGAALRWEENRALVASDEEAHRLTIRIDGTEATRRSLLNSIRMQLHAIHRAFPNLAVTEQVPIPGHPGKTIDYEELRWYEAEGDLQPRYAPIRGRIDVKALLDGIETPEMQLEMKLYRILQKGFSSFELKELCAELNINFNELPEGVPATQQALALVEYVKRRNRLAELEAALREKRPYPPH